MNAIQRWVIANYFDKFQVPIGGHHIRGWGDIRIRTPDIFEYEAMAMGYELGALRLNDRDRREAYIERGYAEPEAARIYAGRSCLILPRIPRGIRTEMYPYGR